MNIIEDAIKYVKNIFENDYSGHDFYHTLRVYRMATYLAEKENADMEIVQLAALLHDVDDRKLSPETYHSKDRTIIFLKKHGVGLPVINRICGILNEVSYAGKDSIVPTTIEGKCVQDADRLDALGAIGIARTFAYGGTHNRKIYDPNIKPNEEMDCKEYYANESTSLNHFYEKLFKLENLMNTDSAKIIAKKRNNIMQDYVNEFFREWDGTDYRTGDSIINDNDIVKIDLNP